MFEYLTYPQIKSPHPNYGTNPSWSIGSLDDDSGCYPMSGDDIALYRAGVERAS